MIKRSSISIFKCIHKSTKNSGFTIVELLVVIVVIGILAAITIVSYTGISQKATVASIQSDLTNASNILKLDQVTVGAFPVDIASANTNKGISSCSGSTTCAYVVSSSIAPQGFCLAVTKNLTTYRITNDGTPTLGDCQNYGLLVDLDAGDSMSYPAPFNGTTWNDTSGNSRNGLLQNGVSYNSSNSGNLVFNGTNQYVLGVSNLGISGNAEFTMCGWVKWTGLAWSSDYPSFMGNNSTGLVNQGLSFTLSGGRPAIDFWNNRWRSGTALNINTWYHICGTKTPGTISTKSIIYVNGVLASGAVENDSIPNIVNSPVVVGRLDTSRWFQGSVGEIRVYSRALPIAEVQQYFNNTKVRYGL